MPKVVVIGAGWAGCATALYAAKAGAEVTLLEKTDMLLGTGLAGGIARGDGRFTAVEEAKAIGCAELFDLMDSLARHKNIDLPRSQQHVTIFDVYQIEPEVRRILNRAGVRILLMARAADAKMMGGKITSVVSDDRKEIRGDSFVDCTGSAGGPDNCRRYGKGCAACVLRCNTFGERISIAEKAGVKQIMGKTADGTIGHMTTACEIKKDTVSPEIRQELDDRGIIVIPLPEELIAACENRTNSLTLLDNGSVILAGYPRFFPLEALRKIPGLEYAQYEDPSSGGVANSIRFLSVAPFDCTMKVLGVDNLFCAGEKAGVVGHAEAIVTGLLAGHNAVREALGSKLLELPKESLIGDFIAFVSEQIRREGLQLPAYTFGGGRYFERMKKLGVYTTNVNEIGEKIKKTDVAEILDKKLTYTNSI